MKMKMKMKMKVWIVDFFEDYDTEYRVFSTRTKAWEYLKQDFIKHHRDEEWINELTRSYNSCCELNLDYFMNDNVIAIERVIE